MKKTIAAALAMLLLLSGCARKQTLSSINQTGEGAVADAGGAYTGQYATGSAGGYSIDPQAEHGLLVERPDGDYIEINEKVFVAQTNDIYLNADDYIGKTIVYEGIYKNELWQGLDEDDSELIHYVIRYGPGCCGSDSDCGFEIQWNGGYPQVDDWVEVIGTLEVYEINGWPYLVVEAQSITVLEERGQEYVFM